MSLLFESVFLSLVGKLDFTVHEFGRVLCQACVVTIAIVGSRESDPFLVGLVSVSAVR